MPNLCLHRRLPGEKRGTKTGRQKREMTKRSPESATSSFDFHLPDDLIARYPARRRDQSRLMVVDRRAGSVTHHRFPELPSFLKKDDLLVVNDSKVFRARLHGSRPSGGKVEILLIRAVKASGVNLPIREEQWEAALRPASRIKAGEKIQLLPDGELRAVSELGNGRWIVSFPSTTARRRTLTRAGHVPLPPYMKRGDEPADLRRYQTVYARTEAEGSVAAPTAGFHFTKKLLRQLEQAGVRRAAVTLHVGPGTFIPIHADQIADHVMEPEIAELPSATARSIVRSKECGGNIIAVGTTTVRTLESAPLARGLTQPFQGPVDLFITPGYRFRCVDSLITNFHLPRSTLFVMVSVFGGAELMQRAYAEAIRERYRFYSYGDAMLIR